MPRLDGPGDTVAAGPAVDSLKPAPPVRGRPFALAGSIWLARLPAALCQRGAIICRATVVTGGAIELLRRQCIR